MNERNPFWKLSRRDLMKLVPPSVAGWMLPSAAGARSDEIETAAKVELKAAAKEWAADWIWESAQGVPPGMSYGSNLFVYFRKTIDLQQSPTKALAQISADSRYKLYVNGHFVGRGPARYDPTWQYYDEYDIAPFLQSGKNAVATLVHYYGQPTGWYMVGRPGFLFECKFDRGPNLIKTDASWKFLHAPMWNQDAPRINGALGFTEIYDARKDVEGWNLPEFDDSTWSEVHVINRVSGEDVPMMDPYPWDNMVARDIPPLMEMEVTPSQVTMVGEVKNLRAGEAPTPAHEMSQETPGPLKNCAVENAKSLAAKDGSETVIRTSPLGNSDSYSAAIALDFGREVTGRLILELEGVAAGMVDTGVCESLADGRVTPMRNGLHFNRYTMKDGPQRWEAFEWDGFRYLQLTIRNCPRPIKLRKVAVNFTSYPVGKRGSFESNDSMLNKIWETSRYTVQLCMHDAYEDCPNREQRQWVGDAYVETKVTYSVFGDTKLPAKYLRQIAQSQRSDGILMMFWPGDGNGAELSRLNIKDFVLHWISTVWEYYRYTGDLEMVRELFPVIVKALGWFEGRIDSDGLLSNITPWVFGDWAPIDKRGRNTILNALFYNVLRESARMATLVGDESLARKYNTLADHAQAGINNHLWDNQRGVYVDGNLDGVKSRRVSQQANSMCLLYDIASPDKHHRMISYIFDETRIKPPEKYKPAKTSFDEETEVVQAQPFFMHWVNASLAHAGEYELMTRLIRSLWGNMIEAGATTIWEVWGREASECHGWSATPAFDLMTYTLGVRGVIPGFEEFAIEPHPAKLEWARGVFPSVKGDIPVSWHSSPEEFRIEGDVPAATSASVLIPLPTGKKISSIELNGKAVWNNDAPSGAVNAKTETNGIRIRLSQSGHYKISARY